MMKQTYTVLIRKTKLEYVAICLELNVTARGRDLPETETNLKNAIEIILNTRLNICGAIRIT